MQSPLFPVRMNPPTNPPPAVREIVKASWEEYTHWPAFRASHGKYLKPEYSLRWFRHMLEHGVKPTKGMDLGTLVHALLFEPDLAMQQVSISDHWTDDEGKLLTELYTPQGLTSTNLYKAHKKKAEADGLTVFKQADVDRALLARDSVQRFRIDHEVFPELAQWQTLGEVIEAAQCEVSARMIDERTGVPVKGRADIWLPQALAIFDLKCFQIDNPQKYPTEWAFAGQVRNLGYAESAAHYLRLFQMERFYWIVVHPNATYEVRLWKLDDVWRAAAEQRLDGYIDRYKQHLDGLDDAPPQGILKAPYGEAVLMEEAESPGDVAEAIDSLEGLFA